MPLEISQKKANIRVLFTSTSTSTSTSTISMTQHEFPLPNPDPCTLEIESAEEYLSGTLQEMITDANRNKVNETLGTRPISFEEITRKSYRDQIKVLLRPLNMAFERGNTTPTDAGFFGTQLLKGIEAYEERLSENKDTKNEDEKSVSEW